MEKLLAGGGIKTVTVATQDQGLHGARVRHKDERGKEGTREAPMSCSW
jgi:hypothetical protein